MAKSPAGHTYPRPDREPVTVRASPSTDPVLITGSDGGNEAFGRDAVVGSVIPDADQLRPAHRALSGLW